MQSIDVVVFDLVGFVVSIRWSSSEVRARKPPFYTSPKTPPPTFRTTVT